MSSAGLEAVPVNEHLILFVSPSRAFFNAKAEPGSRLQLGVLSSGDEKPSVWVESRCGGTEAIDRLKAAQPKWSTYGCARFTGNDVERFEITAFYTPLSCEGMPEEFRPAHASLFGIVRPGVHRPNALKFLDSERFYPPGVPVRR